MYFWGSLGFMGLLVDNNVICIKESLDNSILYFCNTSLEIGLQLTYLQYDHSHGYCNTQLSKIMNPWNNAIGDIVNAKRTFC